MNKEVEPWPLWLRIGAIIVVAVVVALAFVGIIYNIRIFELSGRLFAYGFLIYGLYYIFFKRQKQPA